MSFDATSADIVLLAWERQLGFADGSFAAADRRLVRVAQEAPAVSFVRLFGRSALVAPAAVVQRAASLDDEELADHAVLLRLTRDLGGHGLGMSSLYFADDLPVRQPAREITVSLDLSDARSLEKRCPPDDVNELGLSQGQHSFTLMDDEGPAACGAYSEVQRLLAQLRVLVAPDRRRKGMGQLAAAITAHEALASGLIVQWRTEVSNTASNKLAHSLELDWAGTQTSVLLR